MNFMSKYLDARCLLKCLEAKFFKTKYLVEINLQIKKRRRCQEVTNCQILGKSNCTRYVQMVVLDLDWRDLNKTINNIPIK